MKLARLAAALVIVACNKPAPAPSPPGTVAVTADEHGFTPSSVSFKKGAPASLVVTRTSDDTCATEIVIEDLHVRKALPKNQPVSIDIPTDTARTLTFQCGMGMFKSSIVVK